MMNLKKEKRNENFISKEKKFQRKNSKNSIEVNMNRSFLLNENEKCED